MSQGGANMNKAFYIPFLWMISFGPVLGDVQFRMEMQNHTDAELHVVCKTITGYQKWIFSKGKVKVPPHSAVIESIEIPRVSQHPNEEIQCTYSGDSVSHHRHAVKIQEKTTDSFAVNASFGGVLRLVVNPAVSKKTETEAILDTDSEFMMASGD